MKKWILILTIVCTAFGANAEEAALSSCGTNCTYTIENNVLTIKPIDETKPAKVQQYNRGCTSGCYTDAPWYGQGITTINIQEGVTDIGGHAFEDLGSATSLSLPEGLQNIGSESFHGTSITSLELPSTVKSIGQYAFAISTLEDISPLPEGLKTIGNMVFANTKITDLVIPSEAKIVSEKAFGYFERGWNNSTIQNLYCEEKIADQCAAAIQWREDNGAEVKVIPYQRTSNGQFFYNNKWYNNPSDILSGNYTQKRIYTVDEANKVSGKKNTFKIRYK